MTREEATAVRPKFTAKQGQYLAFIHQYLQTHPLPPSEVDLRRFFGVSSPSAHHMVLTLEKRGLIARTPGRARSIRLLVPTAELPKLLETPLPPGPGGRRHLEIGQD